MGVITFPSGNKPLKSFGFESRLALLTKRLPLGGRFFVMATRKADTMLAWGCLTTANQGKTSEAGLASVMATRKADTMLAWGMLDDR